MIRAELRELDRDVVPVVEAHLPRHLVERLIPVELSELDPLAEPEPSLGALLRLDAGLLAVAVYGTVTETLTLHLAEDAASDEAIEAMLDNISIPQRTISWRRGTAAADPAAELFAS